MREDWVQVLYKDAVKKISTTKQKLKQKDYQSFGALPIVDQGQATVGGFTDDSSRMLKCNLPVIVFGDHTKAVKLINFEFAPGADGTKVLEPKEFISPKFLAYLSEVIVFKIKDKGYARHYQYVEKELISFPSLPEQKAIVKKIETLFTALDKGIEDIKKAQQQLKIYRQAVLKKAFEGEFLTNQQISKPVLIKLGSVIDKPKYGTSKKCIEKPHGKAVLRIPNLKNEVIDIDELKYAEFDEAEIEKFALKEGDLLTIRSNGSVDLVGKCALISKNDTNFLYAGYLIRIRPDASKILSKYLLYCMKSQELRVQIESKAKSTSGVNNINSGELESLNIPYFNIEEQHQIVKEIETRLSVCDQLEEAIKSSLEKSEALRQSILKKAFEGKLLSEQEIAQCKLDKDYEPAGVLLRRIEQNRNEKVKSKTK